MEVFYGITSEIVIRQLNKDTDILIMMAWSLTATRVGENRTR